MAKGQLLKVKIRSEPEEFRVHEISSLEPCGGAYALYELTKRSIGTLEAVEVISRRLGIPRRRISFGGMKDRHALTSQHITILRGPRRHITLGDVRLLYLGQTSEPMSARHVAGNRFCIVVRAIPEARMDYIDRRLQSVRVDGYPNYFGQQRFGSVGVSGEFIAKAWLLGNYERALWLALAEENPSDRAAERKEKQVLREHWGDWETCCKLLSRSHRRSIVFYLRDHPTDFRGAFARLRRDLRALYLVAYQSYLWNELVNAWLQRHVDEHDFLEVWLRVGRVSFPLSLPGYLRPELEHLRVPLPSARVRLHGEFEELLETVLQHEGIELRQLRSRHIRDVFFPRAARALFVRPTGLEWSWSPDERNAGCKKVQLQFTLPSGSYATVLIQAITVIPATGDDSGESPPG